MAALCTWAKLQVILEIYLINFHSPNKVSDIIYIKAFEYRQLPSITRPHDKTFHKLY